ncbi:MAG TPA: metallophosphoesterase [Paludibacter sp.]|nr:metallophosphoesterase [Paludibacter sp.]
MKVTRYKIKGPTLKIAVVADLHGEPTEELITALKAEQPDLIAIPGDLCTIDEPEGRVVDSVKHERRLQEQKRALEFLETAVQISPVYYSRGNHEHGCNNEYRERVKATGAVLLEDKWMRFGDVWIGGLTSAKHYGLEGATEKAPLPDIEWMRKKPEGFKSLLLCHHPEYYDLIKDYVDYVFSGHTHGGQWRFFGRGIFAPGQGLFPKYSRGQYGKMIVSAGLSNPASVPRLFNPMELVIIEMKDENE